MQPAVARLIRSQTILNVAVNAVLPTVVPWLAGVPAPSHVMGFGGLLQALVIGVTLGTVLTFLATKATVRRQLARSAVPHLSRQQLRSVVRLMPPSDGAALVCILAVALAVIIPAGIAIATVARQLQLDPAGFALANAMVGIAIALWVAPRVVLHTLATTAILPDR